MLLAWGSWRVPAAIWAPGDLSRAHADVERCRDCHEPFVGITAGACLHCHTEGEFARIAAVDIADLHRPFLDGSRDCLDCHTEHRGALAAITVGGWENPHGEFVFRATGADSCGDCHDSARLDTSPHRPCSTTIWCGTCIAKARERTVAAAVPTACAVIVADGWNRTRVATTIRSRFPGRRLVSSPAPYPPPTAAAHPPRSGACSPGPAGTPGQRPGRRWPQRGA